MDEDKLSPPFDLDKKDDLSQARVSDQTLEGEPNSDGSRPSQVVLPLLRYTCTCNGLGNSVALF